MPAAAVIPAPIAYIKVVAVKKLVVEFLFRESHAASVRIVDYSKHFSKTHGALNCVALRLDLLL